MSLLASASTLVSKKKKSTLRPLFSPFPRPGGSKAPPPPPPPPPAPLSGPRRTSASPVMVTWSRPLASLGPTSQSNQAFTGCFRLLSSSPVACYLLSGRFHFPPKPPSTRDTPSCPPALSIS
ncbi:unnamed protein product [Ectocarpus fasciculatus]